jgi:hypothetical protein
MTQIAVTELLHPITEIVRQCPTSTLIRNYIRAARKLCNDSRLLLRNTTAVTIANDPQYVIGDNPYEEVIGIKGMSYINGQNRVQAITERDAAEWDANESADEPEFYEYLPHSEFVLGPTPNAVYNLTLTLVVQPKRGAVTIERNLLVDWSDALEHGALYYLLRIKGQPWSDPAESTNQLVLFVDQINRAKSAVAAGHNAGASQTQHIGGASGRVRTQMQPI